MRKRLERNEKGRVWEAEAEAAGKLSSAFAEESNWVREVLAEDAAPHSPVSMAAHESFATVHARLMSAIETEIVPAADTRRQRPRQLPSTSEDVPHPWLRALDAINPFRSSVRIAFGRYAAALFLMAIAGLGGHFFGHNEDARTLPIQSIVDDFEAGTKSPMPLDFVSADASDAKPAAHWLSTHVGRKVSLPAPKRTGTKIVGVGRHEIWGHSVAQAHYLKNGVRVALYQIHEPRAGLRGLHVAKVNGETFMTTQRGDYHVVVWRKGDDIMTMVSPLQREPSLRLASLLRDAPPDDGTAQSATDTSSNASSDNDDNGSASDDSSSDDMPGETPPV